MKPLLHRSNRELAVTMASSAGLELCWSTVAIGAALLGIVSAEPLVMSAIAAVALAFALLARSGELANRWLGERDRREPATAEAVGLNIAGALGALALAALAIAGVAAPYLAPIALLVLAGLLILDAPFERELAAPRGATAGGVMAIAGLGAVVLLTAAFSARAGEPVLVPWAALLLATAHLVGAAALLLRFARDARS